MNLMLSLAIVLYHTIKIYLIADMAAIIASFGVNFMGSNTSIYDRFSHFS